MHSGEQGAFAALYCKLHRLLAPELRVNQLGLWSSYLFSLGQVAASVAAPYYLSVILDRAIPEQDLPLFYRSAILIILTFILLFVSSLLTARFEVQSIERVFQGLRNRVVASLLRKPLALFSMHDSGDLITRVSHDTESLSRIVFDFIFPSLRHATFVLVTVVFMLAWEWRLGLYTVAALPAYLLLTVIFEKPLATASALARQRLSEQNETLLDILSGIRELSFFQQQKQGERRFMASSALFTSANIRSLLLGEWAFNGMELFARVVTLLPFLVGGYWIFRGDQQITVGELVAYNLYLTYLSATMITMLYGWTRMIQISPMLQRLHELLDFPEPELAAPGEQADILSGTRIELRNIGFCHANGKQVLEDFSLVVEPGEKLAIVGPSGSGKSTLIELLIRQLAPQSGEILFGGRPAGEYPLPLYLQHFGYVRQQPYLFKLTVRENIAAGWYGVPDEVVIDAARRVRLHEQIMHLPEGYDTVIGVNGQDLSGGQRQRLALARAMVRDPEILLLDEFTSALDGPTEAAVLDDLFQSFSRQTIICVTHSQAVAGRFERVIRLEKR